MENTIISPSGNKGVNTDVHPLQIGESDLIYALNAMIEDRGGNGYFVGNEYGTELGLKFPPGKQVTGYLRIPELQRILIFLSSLPVTQTLNSCGTGNAFTEIGGEIGEIRTTAKSAAPYYEYAALVESNCLSFNVHYPVSATYQLTASELRVYFVDGYNFDKRLYFEFTEDSVTRGLTIHPDFVSGDHINCEALKDNPAVSRLHLTADSVTNGGTLAAGLYQFWGAYCDEAGNERTDYQAKTGLVSIGDRKVYTQQGYVTNQAVKLKINADRNIYKYFTLQVLYIVNGQTEIKRIGTFPVSQTEYLYTGSAVYQTGGLSELLTKKVYYDHSAGLITAGDKLIKWSVTEKVKANFQRCFLNLPLQWVTTQLPEGAYTDGIVAEKYKSAMRDEIYPYGIVLEFDDGDDSPVINIPGRMFRSSDVVPVNNKDATAYTNQGGCETTIVPYWKLYNTATVTGKPREPYKPCTETTWEYGDMGYWESTERYPDDPVVWGELAGQPIRHHKFPDSTVSHIHDGINTGLTVQKKFGEVNYIYPVGVRVDPDDVRLALDKGVQNCWITPEIRKRITGFRIVRGDRVGNASVLGKGQLYDVNTYSKHNKTYYYPNYPLNDVRDDPFLTKEGLSTLNLNETISTQGAPYYVYPPDNSGGTNVIRYQFDTLQEANAAVPDPPNDEGWRVEPTIYTEENNLNGQKLSFTPTGRYTFHSPEIHFTSAGKPTILKLETEEFGEAEGYFTAAEDQAKQKLLNQLAIDFVYNAVRVSLAKDFIGDIFQGTIFSSIVPTSTVSIPVAQTSEYSYVVTPGDSLGVSNKTVSADDVYTTAYNNAYVNEPYSATYTASYSLTTSDFNNILGAFKRNNSWERFFKHVKYSEIFRKMIEAIAPWFNYNLQFQTVGWYNNYKSVPNIGNKVRALESVTMLEPSIQTVLDDGTSSTLFNNRDREKSMYLKLKPAAKPAVIETAAQKAARLTSMLLPRCTVTDTTRYLASQVTTTDDLSKRIYRPTSSYYAAIKVDRPDQYGSIDSVFYLETGGKSVLLSETQSVNLFGGDTFIGRFSVKRKHSFFTQHRYNQPNGSQVLYSKLGNVAEPVYFYNTFEGLLGGDGIDLSLLPDRLIESLYRLPKFRLDFRTHKVLYDEGYIYSFSYGIPYFLCESAVNLDMRYASETVSGQFYPLVGDLDEWLQERTVPIKRDNEFYYDQTYSRADRHNMLVVLPKYFKPNQYLKALHPNRVIYSEQRADGLSGDRWLIFKPLNYYDFRLENGKLIALHELEGDRVLARFERGSKLFNAYSTLQLDNQTVQLGNGGLFAQKPQEFSRTDGGYVGTQHRAFVRTPYGHAGVDAQEGKIFLYGTSGSGLDEISRYGQYNWFKENLPFKIKRYLPEVPVDNAYWGAGLIIGYDERFHRILITKRDWNVLHSDIWYDVVYQRFMLNDQPVDLSDTRYFENCSWTASYNLYTKTWIYHSYTPDWYVGLSDVVLHGYNSKSPANADVWVQGKTVQLYQQFRGDNYPYILEMQNQNTGIDTYLWGISYKHEIRNYLTPQEYRAVEGITYNKAVIWNEYQSSGLLTLKIANPKSQRDRIMQMIQRNERTDIMVHPDLQGKWNFNQLEDRAKFGYTQFWDYSPGMHEKTPNPDAIELRTSPFNRHGDFKSHQHRVAFINDKYTQYRFIHLFTSLNCKP